jgi:hypothetical protein
MPTDRHKDEPADDGSTGVVTLVKTLAILFVAGIYLVILLKILFLK